MAWKNKLNKNSHYDSSIPIRISSHMFELCLTKKNDSVFGKTGIKVTLNILKSSHGLFDKKFVPDIALHNIPHVEKYYLVAGGIMINVPHMYEPMKNHHLIQLYFGEDT